MRNSFKTLVMLISISIVPTLACAETCSRNDENAIDKKISKINNDLRSKRHSANWGSQLNEIYQKYSKKGCDDGYIAESISDVIVKLLAAEWPSLNQLFALMKKDQGFSEFIVRHIDATTDWSDLDKITLNSKTSCAKDLKTFCDRIGKASADASIEAKNTAATRH